ncbi:MAG: hypothetical protein KAU50_12595, partial [Candidatus Marinimicrobia bacterium]|nr:hypothetical protein [Candidatus Neomarinimicrobiota bacterium]
SGAEPVAETDRYALARLAERPELMRQRIESFSFNPFPATENQCVLEAYFYTLPVNKFRVDGFMNKAFIKALRKKFSVITDALPGYLDFDDYSTSHSSYILRLRSLPKDFTEQTVTLELFNNGSLKMYIPLEGMPVPVPEEDLFEIERQFLHLTDFENHLGRAQAARLRVIDGYKLLVSFTVLVEQYLGLLRQKSYVNPLKVRFRLANALHTLLFFDNQGYLDYLNEYGPPICFKDEIEIPLFEGGNTYEVAVTESPMVFMGILFGAMGLPPAFVPSAMRGLERYLNGLQVKSRMSAKVLSLFDN